jgi:hypothetical protein
MTQNWVWNVELITRNGPGATKGISIKLCIVMFKSVYLDFVQHPSSLYKNTKLQKWILCRSLGGEEDINRTHFENVFFFYIKNKDTEQRTRILNKFQINNLKHCIMSSSNNFKVRYFSWSVPLYPECLWVPIQLPIQWIPKVLSLGVKQLVCEADHWNSFSSKVNIASWSFISHSIMHHYGMVLN